MCYISSIKDIYIYVSASIKTEKGIYTNMKTKETVGNIRG